MRRTIETIQGVAGGLFQRPESIEINLSSNENETLAIFYEKLEKFPNLKILKNGIIHFLKHIHVKLLLRFVGCFV